MKPKMAFSFLAAALMAAVSGAGSYAGFSQPISRPPRRTRRTGRGNTRGRGNGSSWKALWATPAREAPAFKAAEAKRARKNQIRRSNNTLRQYGQARQAAQWVRQ